jgi:hypothetical protein
MDSEGVKLTKNRGSWIGSMASLGVGRLIPVAFWKYLELPDFGLQELTPFIVLL